VYEYQCPVCGIFEFEQSIKDAPLDTCILWPGTIGVECGEPVQRLISKASFVLKGDGWAKDNYAGKLSQHSPGGKKQ